MTEFKDHFSRHAKDYRRYRPHYPERLFEYLASLCRSHDRAWDCGCGSGQAAHALSRYFKAVVATDASAEQIGRAEPAGGIDFRIASAERSGLEDTSVDLVLVAQALHWFDFSAFYREVGRVGRPGGVLAAVAYGLLRVDPDVDRLVDDLYRDCLEHDWPPERHHIDERYETIPFPFAELPCPDIEMSVQWDFERFAGYLETWSAVRRHRERTGRCPVKSMIGELSAAWGERGSIKTVAWPLYLKIGRID